MTVNQTNQAASYGEPGKDFSIEDQLKKLEEQKRKIEKDLQHHSTNPDPLAARGDDDANREVNKKILQQIEQRIRVLEDRRTQHEQNIKQSQESSGRQRSNPMNHLIDIYA